MSMTLNHTAFYIGWDVGGWNCDHNPRSRDAIVILDADLHPVGTVWRGNLREAINSSATASDWVRALFRECRAKCPPEFAITLAIDAPLGFSREFIQLIKDGNTCGPIGQSRDNRYLYRNTERVMFARDQPPLSAVKDMIGSQSTKAIHALARFAPERVACGVWRSPDGVLTAIESCPAACRGSPTLAGLRHCGPLMNDDQEDALTCALVASVFATDRDQLVAPPADVPVEEGWIWVPQDAVPVVARS